MGAFNFKIHFYFGVVVWVLAFQADIFLNPVTVLIGAILPDADHRKTIQGMILPLWRFFKHRRFVHSIPCLVIFACITGLVWNWWAGWSLALGYGSHLFLDACTPSGINWWGIRKRPHARGKRS